jgi:hypothetical protein
MDWMAISLLLELTGLEARIWYFVVLISACSFLSHECHLQSTRVYFRNPGYPKKRLIPR